MPDNDKQAQVLEPLSFDDLNALFLPTHTLDDADLHSLSLSQNSVAIEHSSMKTLNQGVVDLRAWVASEVPGRASFSSHAEDLFQKFHIAPIEDMAMDFISKLAEGIADLFTKIFFLAAMCVFLKRAMEIADIAFGHVAKHARSAGISINKFKSFGRLIEEPVMA